MKTEYKLLICAVVGFGVLYLLNKKYKSTTISTTSNNPELLSSPSNAPAATITKKAPQPISNSASSAQPSVISNAPTPCQSLISQLTSLRASLMNADCAKATTIVNQMNIVVNSLNANGCTDGSSGKQYTTYPNPCEPE